MNRRKIIWLVSMVTIFAAVLLSGYYSIGTAKENAETKFRMKLQKPDVVDQILVGVNNWSYYMRSDGTYMWDKVRGPAGGEFPRGSHVTIVFAGGFYVATVRNGVPVCSEVEYSSKFQPGKIIGSGVPFDQLAAEVSSGQSIHTYYIESGNTTSSDYLNWPGDKQADGTTPALICAAQTWDVVNDINTALAVKKETNPLNGIGLQVIYESFNLTAGPSADVVYMKFTITNKTGTDYPNSYIGLWMDADVDATYATNDVVGVDTARGLGYTYNGDNADLASDGFSRATGFDFFQGPVVDTTEVSGALVNKFRQNNQTLVYDPVQNIYVPTALPGNQIWLGATSFNTYANGKDPHTDVGRYNLMAGKFIDGTPKYGHGISDYYAFRGDPNVPGPDVATVGDEADQRMLHGVGPFTLKAGSSQVIWAGVVGGRGTDRLAGVNKMFATDDAAQIIFNKGLVNPVPPDAPQIIVTPLDKKVVITWANNSEYSADRYGELTGITVGNGYTATYKKYDFEGYRVYKSLTGQSWTQLAQYDKADGITDVWDAFIDDKGVLEIRKNSVGTDNGLKYSYVDSGNVVNGQKYYYSVTAYDAQPYIGGPGTTPDPISGQAIPSPNGIPISLETAQSINAVAVVPGAQTIQTTIQSDYGNLTHPLGASDGKISFQIVDQSKITGHIYNIKFWYISATVGTKTLVDPIGGMAGTKVYSIYDSSNANALVHFSSKTDNAASFYDGNANGKLDLDTLPLTTNHPAHLPILGDSLFDETTWSSAIDMPGSQYDIFDGIRIIVTAPSVYFKSVKYAAGTQYTTAGVTKPWFDGWDLSNPNNGSSVISETYGDTANGGVDGAIASPPNGVDGNIFGAIFAAQTPGADLRQDVDMVFSRDSTKWSYAYAVTGGGGGAAITRYIRVPYQAFAIVNGTPVQINTKMRERSTAGTASQCWMPYNGGNGGGANDGSFTADGTGPNTRGYLAYDLTTYDAGFPALSSGTGSGSSAGLTLNAHAIGAAGDKVYAVFNPVPRVLASKPGGIKDGVDWNTFGKTVFNAGTSVNSGQQGTIYRQIPDEGTIHVKLNHTYTTADKYTLKTVGNAARTSSQVGNAMNNILVVPNPYYGRSSYQASLFDKRIKFTNLPDNCTIKIFTVAGDLITTLTHSATSNNDRVNTNPLSATYTPGQKTTTYETWDLRNTGGKFVASGMYIGLVQSSFGKKIVKFAVIQEEIQINGPDVR